MEKKTLVVYRVPYGKKNTPPSKREYFMGMGSPVGTKKEWRDFVKKNAYKGVSLKFME